MGRKMETGRGGIELNTRLLWSQYRAPKQVSKAQPIPSKGEGNWKGRTIWPNAAGGRVSYVQVSRHVTWVSAGMRLFCIGEVILVNAFGDPQSR